VNESLAQENPDKILPPGIVRNFVSARPTHDGAVLLPAPYELMIATVLLILLGSYLACGFVFAVPFVLFGVKRIDPHAARGSWGFRVLILPGTTAFWPLLLRRWLNGIHEPPEECNPHRCAAKSKL
jgi:hypothetical protein